MTAVYYSWIIPVYNEDQSLPQLFAEIQKSSLANYEIIIINDGSKDNSLKTLKKLAQNKPSIKIIHFKTRQGKWVSLAAGFKVAHGQIIITSDSDLQDDPREVSKLLKMINQGYDLVSGWRKVRFDPLYKILISQLGNRLASILTRRRFQDLNSPFKVYKREVLKNLPMGGSLLRFTMLFAYNLGFRTIEVPIKGRSRLFGKSKFGFIKYLRILYDLVLIFLLFRGSGRISLAKLEKVKK